MAERGVAERAVAERAAERLCEHDRGEHCCDGQRSLGVGHRRPDPHRADRGERAGPRP
ncbi:MAG: hypothetical protein V9E94_20500 [Microthrixaceae bacterium]